MARLLVTALLSSVLVPLAGKCEVADPDVSTLAAMCQSTVNRPADSFTSLETQNWIDSVRSSMCESQFHDSASFTSAAGSLGVSLPVVGDIFGLDASGSYSDSQAQTAYSNVCVNRQAVDAGNSLAFIQSSQVSQAMAHAFETCVSALPKIFKSVSKSSIVLTVEESGENSFDYSIRDYNTAPLHSISFITGVKSCALGASNFTPGRQVHFPSGIVNFTGTCQRKSEDSANVSFSTDLGASNFVTLPSYTPITKQQQSQIDALQQEIVDLSQKVKVASNQISQTIQADAGQLNALSSKIPAPEQFWQLRYTMQTPNYEDHTFTVPFQVDQAWAYPENKITEADRVDLYGIVGNTVRVISQAHGDGVIVYHVFAVGH